MKLLAIQSGKSRQAQMMLDAMLDAGKRVLVIRHGGNSFYEKNAQGVVVVTPVPTPKPPPVIYNEGVNWIKDRFLSESGTISREAWDGWVKR